MIVQLSGKCTFLFCFVLFAGALFDSVPNSNEGGHVSDETAFRYAIESINYNHILFNNSRLSPHYEKIPQSDSYHAAKRG